MSKIDPIVFIPDEPIEIGEGDASRAVNKLTFPRMMRGKDLLAMDAVEGETHSAFAMYASMCSQPITVFYEMSLDDFARLAIEVAPLMGKKAPALLKKLQAGNTAGATGE